MTDLYRYWRQERKAPGSQPRDTNEPIAGFWRHDGAKSKPSWPVAIWYDGNASDGIAHHKVGNSQKDGDDALIEFKGESTWHKCSAVTQAEYDAAMATGFWADGKNARHMDDAEKMGIETDAGDNNAPPHETIGEQIEAAVAKADAIKSIKTADEARIANELAEKLNALFRLGDAERDKQKRPHDDASKAVQALWLPIITPASTARERLVGKGGLVKQWLKAEQDRVDNEARIERERIAAENLRIQQENDKAAAEAAGRGEDAPAPVAAPLFVNAPEPVRARAASTFGRAASLRKVTKAEITDIKALLDALSTHKEMIEFAQTLANRAAKAGIPLAGMKIVETME